MSGPSQCGTGEKHDMKRGRTGSQGADLHRTLVKEDHPLPATVQMLDRHRDVRPLKPKAAGQHSLPLRILSGLILSTS